MSSNVEALKARQRELEQRQAALDSEVNAIVDQLDNLDEQIAEAEAQAQGGPALMSDKPTENRYSRPSVNWGTIAVHPTDLFAVYKGIAGDRTGFIAVNQGGRSTRTTAIALAMLSRDALLSNGYTPEEVAVILASVTAE